MISTPNIEDTELDNVDILEPNNELNYSDDYIKNITQEI